MGTFITAERAGGPEVRAFLGMIARSELGALCDDPAAFGYDVLVGATPTHPIRFGSYAHHPRVYNAKFNSTAAGRYQIIWPTWNPLQLRLHLPDFGPLSQDLAAIALIREAGALGLVQTSRIEEAIRKCSGIWASFPGGAPDQPKRDLNWLLAQYHRELGDPAFASGFD
jgi:muramidase (phage lysozyme)